MTLDVVISIAALAVFIWAVRVMLPRAVKEHDRLALTAAVLTVLAALLAWFWIGVRVQ